MKSPLENIIDWFGALPTTYRQAVALEVAAMMPDMKPKFSNPFFHKEFMATISQPQADRSKEMGLAICLTALIEDIIATRTKECEEWMAMQKELKEMAQLTGSCSIAEEAFLKESQYKQWTAIRETWEAMAGQSLNSHALSLWRKT